ncbi:MAG: hypothetical protein JWO82_1279 [Akkermansiaceae bacterium]|nr:hypothetical protein [Akkermansiaceae bacterium]
MTKDPDDGRGTPSRRPIWIGAGLACLLATALLTVVNHKESKLKAGENAPPVLREQTASNGPETEAGLIARRVELGMNAVSALSADPNGPLAPAMVPEREVIGSGWKNDKTPAMADFSAWTDRYLAASGSERSKLENEGVKLAEARREALLAQIVSDPRTALANALPLAVRGQLPDGVQAKLERRVDAYGDISVMNAMAVPGGGPIEPSDRAAIDGTFYEAHRYGDLTNVPYALDAPLHGIAVAGKMAVLDSPVRMLEEGEKLAGSVVNEACPVSNKTVATAGAGTVPKGNETVFQVGPEIYQTCEPDHVTNVEAAIVAGEKQAQPTGKTIAEMGLHALCMPKPQALGDSGSAGSAGYIGKPPSSITHGGKNILVMRVQASDGAYPANGSPTDFNNMFFGAGGFDTRMRRISYNQTWLNAADVTNLMTLPQPKTYYVGNPLGSAYDCNRWITDAKAAAVAAGYNLSNYAQLIVAHESYNTGAAGLAWGGYIFLNGYFQVEVTLHEYGHTFWLPHANSWYATDGNPISTAKQHREYGDAADPMGNAYGANQYNSFNPYYKNICSWLPDDAVQSVTANGTYRVYQHDGATALNRTLALKIGRDQEFSYWISIHGDPVAQTNFNNGVQVYAVSSWRYSDTHLLDINNPGDDNRDNAPLANGQSWYDAAADLTIRTVAVGGTNPNHYADVQITFGPRNTGAYRPLVSGGVYRLKNRQTGLYLAVPGNSNTNALPVTMESAVVTDGQQWVIWRNADGTYSMNHKGTDKWLDVYGALNTDGADIVQHTGNGSDAQKWYGTLNPSGYMLFARKGTEGKLLDMDSGSANDVHQWGFNGGPSQEWYPELMSMTYGTYRITPRHAQGQVLDVYTASTASGAAIKLNQWNTGSNQKWTLSAATGGYLRITPTSATGLALEVANASDTDGALIRQWTWNDSAAQHWAFSRIDGNWLRFTPQFTTARALDVPGADNQYVDGTATQLGTYSGTQDQQWRFIDPN